MCKNILKQNSELQCLSIIVVVKWLFVISEVINYLIQTALPLSFI